MARAKLRKQQKYAKGSKLHTLMFEIDKEGTAKQKCGAAPGFRCRVGERRVSVALRVNVGLLYRGVGLVSGRVGIV